MSDGEDMSDGALRLLEDTAFEAEAASAIARFESSESADEAETHKREVARFEHERVRRAARQARELDLLFVTVGGQANAPTLAVVATPARFVVLAHTNTEKQRADETIQALRLDATRAALCCIGDGKDSAELYRAVFAEWVKRGRPEKVAIDITGGFKTMSASAAAAGFSLPHGKTYYIDSTQLTVHGVRAWVQEHRIELANPFVVFGELRRASARELLKQHSYAAAAAIYRELDEPADRSRAQLAEAYDALEGLDFQRGATLLDRLCDSLDAFAAHPDKKADAAVSARAAIRANAEGARKLLDVVTRANGEDPVKTAGALSDPACLDLGAMLLARAEAAHTPADVAALFAYRCLELVAQRRLALRGGVNPSALDWNVLASSAHQSLPDFVAAYNKTTRKKEHRLVLDELPAASASALSYGLLHVAFPDDVTSCMDLAAFAGAGEARNRSVLAHGLKKLDDATLNGIRRKARELFETLLEVEQMNSTDRLALKARHTFVEVE